MSPQLQAYFADYAAFHRTAGNQACHYVGIPLIVVSLLSALTAVPLWGGAGVGLTVGEVTLAAVVVYYARLDPRLALLMLGLLAGLDLLGRQVPLRGALALFVVGWLLQFAGHYVYEKKAPAFSRNLVHLLVGPLWIAAKAVGRA
jgi:uncharacterized membrane protein YGL010W